MRGYLPHAPLTLSREFCGLMFLFLVGSMLPWLLPGFGAASNDFSAYWLAGRAFLLELNPYDVASLRHLAQSLGVSSPQTPLMIPPHGLFFLAMLGALPFQVGASLLSGVSLLLLGSIARDLAGDSGRSSVSSFMSASLGPVLVCLFLGQVSIILFALFVRFVVLPYRNGGCVWSIPAWILLTIKPHLVAVVAVVLIRRSGLSRRFAYLALSLLVLTVGALFRVDLDSLIGNVSMVVWHNPTLGGYAAAYFRESGAWTRFLPCVLAMGLAWWDAGRFEREDPFGQICVWSSCGIAVAPYAWMYDFVFVSLGLYYLLSRAKSRQGLRRLCALGLLVQGALLATEPAARAIWFPVGVSIMCGWIAYRAKDEHLTGG